MIWPFKKNPPAPPYKGHVPPHPLPAVRRECCNPECDWMGTTDRMLGSVGPLCPDCGEVTEPALDPDKARLCRVGQHSAERRRSGQPCNCPVGTCSLWKGGLRPADAPVIADNGSLPEGQYVLCFEGDSNGVLLCYGLQHLRNVLTDTFGIMEGGDEFIAHMLDPANWNDHFGETGPMHYFKECVEFSPQRFELHIWRVCGLES